MSLKVCLLYPTRIQHWPTDSNWKLLDRVGKNQVDYLLFIQPSREFTRHGYQTAYSKLILDFPLHKVGDDENKCVIKIVLDLLDKIRDKVICILILIKKIDLKGMCVNRGMMIDVSLQTCRQRVANSSAWNAMTWQEWLWSGNEPDGAIQWRYSAWEGLDCVQRCWRPLKRIHPSSGRNPTVGWNRPMKTWRKQFRLDWRPNWILSSCGQANQPISDREPNPITGLFDQLRRMPKNVRR